MRSANLSGNNETLLRIYKLLPGNWVDLGGGTNIGVKRYQIPATLLVQPQLSL
jgi:hypothetical protein